MHKFAPSLLLFWSVNPKEQSFPFLLCKHSMKESCCVNTSENYHVVPLEYLVKIPAKKPQKYAVFFHQSSTLKMSIGNWSLLWFYLEIPSVVLACCCYLNTASYFVYSVKMRIFIEYSILLCMCSTFCFPVCVCVYVSHMASVKCQLLPPPTHVVHRKTHRKLLKPGSRIAQSGSPP